jgi:PAS domain-containing protein
MWKTIKSDKKKFSATIKNRRKNGEIYYSVAHVAPILDDNEQLIGFIGAEEDISQMKKLENELSQSKERIEALLFSLGEGVVAVDSNQRVIFANHAALTMLGYEEKDLQGKIFIHVVSAVDK